MRHVVYLACGHNYTVAVKPFAPGVGSFHRCPVVKCYQLSRVVKVEKVTKTR